MKKITIGSNPNCDITIGSQDIGVSFRHAFITKNNDGTWTLEDVSKNGTYINGKKIHQDKCIVKYGDEIKITEIPLSWAEIAEIAQDDTYIDIQPLVYGPPPCVYGPPTDILNIGRHRSINRRRLSIIVTIIILIVCALLLWIVP